MEQQDRVRNITDLARLAGVSTGTVSRALADSHLIAKKTRERIQAIAREHDFRPNIMARNLRIKRAGAIGVLIPLGHETGQHISDPFFITLLGQLADALTERDVANYIKQVRELRDENGRLREDIGRTRVEFETLLMRSPLPDGLSAGRSRPTCCSAPSTPAPHRPGCAGPATRSNVWRRSRRSGCRS